MQLRITPGVAGAILRAAVAVFAAGSWDVSEKYFTVYVNEMLTVPWQGTERPDPLPDFTVAF